MLPPPTTSAARAPALRVAAAFAAVYLIWGSTYLFTKWGVETIPPFLMAGTRFVLAGAISYAWARLGGAPRPSLADWRSSAIVGGFLLLGGNGAVVWAARRLPSGVSSLLTATTPLWMVGLDWVRRGGVRPGPRVVTGLALGSLGLVLLVGPGPVSSPGTLDGAGVTAILLGTLSWASGSIYSRGARLPASPLLSVGMQQIAGGGLLIAAAFLSGETTSFDPGAVSLRSFLSVLYLLTFGSLVAYTAYIWLLSVASAARVSTYAYVNPVVAVFLGWALNGEALAPRTILAAAVIVLGVAAITGEKAREGTGGD